MLFSLIQCLFPLLHRSPTNCDASSRLYTDIDVSVFLRSVCVRPLSLGRGVLQHVGEAGTVMWTAHPPRCLEQDHMKLSGVELNSLVFQNISSNLHNHSTSFGYVTLCTSCPILLMCIGALPSSTPHLIICNLLPSARWLWVVRCDLRCLLH